MKTKSIVLAVWLSVAVSVFAQFAPQKGAACAKEAVVSKPTVEVTLVQKKVVQSDNSTERLVDADTGKPGDVIEYQATYINKTDKPVAQVIANLPLLEGLEVRAEERQADRWHADVRAGQAVRRGASVAQVARGQDGTSSVQRIP